MSEFKGTAFPWRKVKGRDAREVFVLGPGEDEEVADVYGQANADLIAAAPDIFASIDPETLEAIADEIGGEFHNSARADSLRVIARKQRAAIKKALGDE